MGSMRVVVPYILGLVLVIVGLDVSLFRHHFWPRLLVNVGVVAIFAGFYLRFHGSPAGGLG